METGYIRYSPITRTTKEFVIVIILFRDNEWKYLVILLNYFTKSLSTNVLFIKCYYS